MLAFGQRSLVEILEWSGLHTRPGGGRFERTFEITVVILVQAANGQLRCALEKSPTRVAAGFGKFVEFRTRNVAEGSAAEFPEASDAVFNRWSFLQGDGIPKKEMQSVDLRTLSPEKWGVR